MKPALVWVGGGCWSRSRKAPVTVGTSLPQNPLCTCSLDPSCVPCAPLLTRACRLSLFPPSPLRVSLGNVCVCSTWGRSDGIMRLPGGCAVGGEDGSGRAMPAGHGLSPCAGDGHCRWRGTGLAQLIFPQCRQRWRVLSRHAHVSSQLCFSSAAPALQGLWHVQSSRT